MYKLKNKYKGRDQQPIRTFETIDEAKKYGQNILGEDKKDYYVEDNTGNRIDGKELK